MNSSRREMIDADPDTIGSLAVHSVTLTVHGEGDTRAGVAQDAGSPFRLYLPLPAR